MNRDAMPDPTQGILQNGLHRLERRELQVLLTALDTHAPATIKLSLDDGSPWFSLVATVVNRAVRKSQIAMNPVERARSVADRALLKETIGARLRELLDRSPEEAPSVRGVDPRSEENSIEAGIRGVYEALLCRTPGRAEIEIWEANLTKGMPFHEFLLIVERGQEAQRVRNAGTSEDVSDAELVQLAYEVILRRGAHPQDINDWTRRLRTGEVTRQGFLATVFGFGRAELKSSEQAHDGLSSWIMGTDRTITVDDWAVRSEELKAGKPNPPPKSQSRFYIHTKPRCLVTAIASLYKGADFIEQFMDNVTSQSIFSDYCELVIVDADSPENEESVIRRYLSKHKNIQYLRMNYRIGIYDAWNVGVRAARGEYLTNTNLDDLRRRDSLELQASVLDNLDFVDVTYQDFYYSFDPELSAEEVAAFGFKSELPVVTPYNMIRFNSPHNAPMWRKRLHDELGGFDTNYKSAGDYEFWMRCLAAKKVFYKLNDPHVVYYQNPHGLSTRADTRGVVEGRDVHRRYCRALTSANITSALSDFGISALGVSVNRAKCLVGEASDRYNMAQSELRQIGRTIKYSSRSAKA
jgi:glycosyltransferase involved in cell wall biosynthesis